jgi:hypothetical protein
MSQSFLNSGTLVILCLFATIRENSSLAKKSAKVYHSLYSSTEQLQMTLGFMFNRFGRNNEKSIHTLPLQSLHLLSPSLILPL